jgi:hypothetical protein
VAIGFGSVVQRLPRVRDRVLAVAYLASSRAEDGWFRPADVTKLFESLRVRPPSNVSEDLARMGDEQLVVRRSTGRVWSLTPNGEDAVVKLVGDLDLAAVEAELAQGGTAELDGVEHPLIPAELAPVRFLPGVRRLLESFPFERNVFCMTRFPPSESHPDDPIARAIDVTRETLHGHGLTMHLARDRQADDELFGNVAAHIWACKYGIALLESLDPDRKGDALNDNVLIEIGAMLISGRRCGLIKDQAAPQPPTDFVAHIYKEIDIADETILSDTVTGWVLEDLKLGP